MSGAVRAGLVGLAVVLAASCTTAPGGGSVAPPEGPMVVAFAATPDQVAAPALVALVWTVVDDDGEDLTCSLDADSDGTPEVVVPHCQGSHSRTVAYPTPGIREASIEVTDGTGIDSDSRLVAVDAGPSEPFDILIREVGSFTAAQEAVFSDAVGRWESAIVRGITDRPVSVAAGGCLPGADPLVGTVDDVVIDAAVRPIDGVGGVLGQAGPCVYWAGDDLPRVGVMEFDSADVDAMLANGTFDDVVLHEMAHVLGLGTMWHVGRNLLDGAGTSDPTFDGPVGMAEWSALGGSGAIPVENSGGPGTADAHWRESVFGTELMTGFVSAGTNPLSSMSLGSLADLGYQIDLGVADAYSLPGPALRAPAAASAEPGVTLRPIPQPG